MAEGLAYNPFETQASNSLYVTLLLFLMTVPGIWSQIKRAPKASVKRKTYEVLGPKAEGAMPLDDRARQVFRCVAHRKLAISRLYTCSLSMHLRCTARGLMCWASYCARCKSMHCNSHKLPMPHASFPTPFLLVFVSVIFRERDCQQVAAHLSERNANPLHGLQFATLTSAVPPCLLPSPPLTGALPGRRYFKKYNYELQKTGEVITFVGTYQADKGQAAALVFYTFFGLGSIALVLSTLFQEVGGWFYSLVLFSPLAGAYYFKKGTREEEVKVRRGKLGLGFRVGVRVGQVGGPPECVLSHKRTRCKCIIGWMT